MNMKPLGFALLLAAVTAAQSPEIGPRFDVIFRHGTVIDGSGLPRYRADVAIANGFIARVGDLSKASAAVDIDATGLFVTPGFINIHSHASPSALATAENMLTQGVTTEILNPDGSGGVDIAQQLARASEPGLALNIGAYIGFNSVWSDVMGSADKRATPEDVERMRALVVGGLEHGAWGVSAGLDYKPAYYAQVEEVIRVVEPARKWRTNFPNHDRITPESNFSSRVGVGETLAIGEKAGLVPVVTHMKAQGLEQRTAGKLLASMTQATRRGAYTAADAYPYLAGQTSLGALMIPAWAQDGGREEMLKRFKDPEQRARIVIETERAMNARFNGAEGVFLPATKQQLVDVMRQQQTSAGETVVRILEQGNVPAILRFGTESDLVKILQYPTTAVACDCGASTETRQHPRAFGTFPRVLGLYVRERKVLTWEDAIRKMTALPANTIGMVDRGFLTPGMAADITVFDPLTVIDHATYEDAGQLSEGIRHVMVNGTFALRDGKATGERGGRVLARTAHMPSRPMTTRVVRQVSAPGGVRLKAESGDMALTLDVTQTSSATHAKGSFGLSDPASGRAIEAIEFGVVQTADKWASFTARVRPVSGADEQSALVIIEQADPWVDLQPATVTVLMDGAPYATGRLSPAALHISTAQPVPRTPGHD
jgi:N-acyl-D-aspartate/D-glutamate deacylase